MEYHLISAALLGAALVLETPGFAGSVAFLGAGVGYEVWFWVRWVRRRRSSLVPRAV